MEYQIKGKQNYNSFIKKNYIIGTKVNQYLHNEIINTHKVFYMNLIIIF